jgi:hypothetical protein
MVTADTLPPDSSFWNAVKVGCWDGSALDVTSLWATKARRTTIRMGNAALLKNLLSGLLPLGDVAEGSSDLCRCRQCGARRNYPGSSAMYGSSR